MKVNNALGIKGVQYRRDVNKFRARIMVNKKPLDLGHFDSVQEAKAAYDKAAMEHHGEFARLN